MLINENWEGLIFSNLHASISRYNRCLVRNQHTNVTTFRDYHVIELLKFIY